MKTAGIKDVAERAKVSAATACNALSGKGRMSESTRSRILQAAKELGYVPNKAAQALSRIPRTIGIFIPAEPYEVQGMFERGILEGLKQYEGFNIKYILKMYPVGRDEDKTLALLEKLMLKSDGMIADPSGSTALAEKLKKLRESKPLVTLVNCPEGLNPNCAVSVDAGACSRIAAQFLSMLGCKSAFMLYGHQPLYSIHAQNIRSFKLSAAEYALDIMGIHKTMDDMNEAYALVKALYSAGWADGIFASSYVAPAICRALNEMQLHKRVKVIGVDLFDKTAACLEDGSLDGVIHQNQFLQAKTAVDMAVELLGGGKVPNTLLMKPELVIKSNYKCYDY